MQWKLSSSVKDIRKTVRTDLPRSHALVFPVWCNVWFHFLFPLSGLSYSGESSRLPWRATPQSGSPSFPFLRWQTPSCHQSFHWLRLCWRWQERCHWLNLDWCQNHSVSDGAVASGEQDVRSEAPKATPDASDSWCRVDPCYLLTWGNWWFRLKLEILSISKRRCNDFHSSKKANMVT